MGNTRSAAAIHITMETNDIPRAATPVAPPGHSGDDTEAPLDTWAAIQQVLRGTRAGYSNSAGTLGQRYSNSSGTLRY